jgi:hypothetical protein
MCGWPFKRREVGLGEGLADGAAADVVTRGERADGHLICDGVAADPGEQSGVVLRRLSLPRLGPGLGGEVRESVFERMEGAAGQGGKPRGADRRRDRAGQDRAQVAGFEVVGAGKPRA